jgi:hypothetical protein
VTEQEIQDRIKVDLAEEGDGWFYLSFADEDGFRGACFVAGNNIGQAAHTAHVLGINPGGQVRGMGPLSPTELNQMVPEQYRNILLDAQIMRDVFKADLWS